MKWNVIITPKKPEIVDADTMSIVDGCLVFERGKTPAQGRRKASPGYICAVFKKWIRVYIFTDKK